MSIMPMLIIGAVIVTILSYLAYRLRTLNGKGAIATVAIGLAVLIGGSPSWFIVVVTFFVLAAIFTRFRYSTKAQIGCAQDKGGARGWPNVVANGGVVGTLGILEFVFNEPIFIAAFLGAMATAMADTLATELGLLSKKAPRYVFDLRKKVNPGTSGGITAVGTASSFVFAAIIGIVAYSVGLLQIGFTQVLFIAIVAGVVGTFVDSILGASVQGLYFSKDQNRYTEIRSPDSKPVKGFRCIDNNVVNVLGTLVGATTATILFLIL
ncbi:MAG: TIGR00297 family protein [Nitrososphaerales archaeon]